MMCLTKPVLWFISLFTSNSRMKFLIVCTVLNKLINFGGIIDEPVQLKGFLRMFICETRLFIEILLTL